MKIIHFIISACLLFSLASCWDKVDPEVSTVYITNGDGEAQRAAALESLLAHYQSSSKDKLFYEAVSKRDGRFILNYNRVDKRLTLCLDPGSGWGPQFADVKETDLENLVSKGIVMLDFEYETERDPNDSTIIFVKGVKLGRPEKFITPKTNGN